MNFEITIFSLNVYVICELVSIISKTNQTDLGHMQFKLVIFLNMKTLIKFYKQSYPSLFVTLQQPNIRSTLTTVTLAVVLSLMNSCPLQRHQVVCDTQMPNQRCDRSVHPAMQVLSNLFLLKSMVSQPERHPQLQLDQLTTNANRYNLCPLSLDCHCPIYENKLVWFNFK